MKDCWNPWHGCRKYSEGCLNCYVYRLDASVGRDASQIQKTGDFALPLRRSRGGEWKIPSGSVLYACMTSDFFLEEADLWRPEAWEIMRKRPDVFFHIITKRVLRVKDCLPPDWGEGYPNVALGATCENQRRAQERMDAFLALPFQEKFLICEPLLGPIDFSPWLPGDIREIIVGGESGPGARELRYEWVLSLRAQCERAKIGFHFKQTGANFVKDGRRYFLERALQIPQARKANIDLPRVSSPENWVYITQRTQGGDFL